MFFGNMGSGQPTTSHGTKQHNGSVMEFLKEAPDLEVATVLTSKGFVQPITEELRQDVANHLVGDIVLSIMDEGTCIGFATFADLGELLYLHGIMLEPGHQGMHVAREAIAVAQAETDAAYLGLQTQNPRMWAVGETICEAWLPHAHYTLLDEDLMLAAKCLSEKLDKKVGVRFGAYGQPLYGKKPTHSNEELQSWWDEMCDFDRGDAVVCLGRLKVRP